MQDTSRNSESQAADHIHSCVRRQIGREIWMNWAASFDLSTCPWQGCQQADLKDPIQAAVHFFTAHVNGAVVGSVCAVQLEQGVCGVPFPDDETERVRHLEMYHGLIALSHFWNSKKSSPADAIPDLKGRVASCSECKIWLKGYAAMHEHAVTHLEADLPKIRQDKLFCQTSYANHIKTGEQASKRSTDRCPFEVFNEALQPIDRWFSGLQSSRSGGYAKHINDMHIFKMDPEEKHELTAKETAKTPYKPLNGDMSRLLTDVRGGRFNNTSDGIDSDGSDAEIHDADLNEDRRPAKRATKAPKPKSDRFSKMTIKDAKAELRHLGLPLLKSAAAEVFRDRLRFYYNEQDGSYAQNLMFLKSTLRSRCEERGLKAGINDDRQDLARKLATDAENNLGTYAELVNLPEADLKQICQRLGLTTASRDTQDSLAMKLATYKPRFNSASEASTAPPQTPTTANLPLIVELDEEEEEDVRFVAVRRKIKMVLDFISSDDDSD
ncbi:hypothetical protein IAT40_004849 [Kwoniella sp. CBS 6097]